MSGRLHDLLFDDDDDDASTNFASSEINGTPIEAPPPSYMAAAQPIPPPSTQPIPPPSTQPIPPPSTQPIPPPSTQPIPPPSTIRKTPSAGNGLIQQMFSLLKQKLAPAVYAELKVQVQTVKSDQKKMMQIVRQIAGEEIVSEISRIIRANREAMMRPPNAAASNVPIAAVQSSAVTEPMRKMSDSSASGAAANLSQHEKMKLFEKLLRHACSCTVQACPQSRCNDIKLLVAHTVGCGNKAQCHHCARFANLAKFHMPLCAIPPSGHCAVPGCDAGRRANAANGMTPAVSNNAQKSATPAAQPGSKYDIYGEVMQLILHAQSCVATPCPFGKKCSESKAILQEMGMPNPTARAATYKQVWTHYQGCQKKDTCPVCIRGTRPLVLAGKATSIRPSQSPASSQMPINTDPLELVPVSSHDIRRDADAITYTGIDLTEEKKSMLLNVGPQLDAEFTNEKSLTSQKVEWNATNFFDRQVLANKMQSIASKHGVRLKPNLESTMAKALQDYVQQVLEELVETKKRYYITETRRNSMLKSGLMSIKQGPKLHTLYDADFKELQLKDAALRRGLLEETRAESLEREQAKKRKKSDRPKADILDDEEGNKDLYELSVKDLKDKLAKQQDEGSAIILGGVNTSVAPDSYRPVFNSRISLQETQYFLDQGLPSVRPEVFCRASAAAIYASKVE